MEDILNAEDNKEEQDLHVRCCGNNLLPAEPDYHSDIDGSPAYTRECNSCGRVVLALYPSGYHRWMGILRDEFHWSDGEIHDENCQTVGTYNNPFSSIPYDGRKEAFEQWLNQQGVRHCFRLVRAEAALDMTQHELDEQYSTDPNGCLEAYADFEDDSRAKFAHALRHDDNWIPVNVESAEAAARDAAYEYAHEIEEGHYLLVGRCYWMGPEEFAEKSIIGDRMLTALDNTVYEHTRDRIDLERERCNEEQLEELEKRVTEVVADWLASLADSPEYFLTQNIKKFKIVTHPDATADGKPEVRPVGEDGGE